METLVVNEISKKIYENGNETILQTNEYKRDCEYIVEKDVKIYGIKVEINEAKFIEQIGTLSSVYYTFTYTGSAWKLNNNTVNLASYGITLKGYSGGEPVEGEFFDVNCDTAEQKVTSVVYSRNVTVYQDANSNIFNYVKIACDNSIIKLSCSYGTSLSTTIISEINSRVEFTYETGYRNLKIRANTTEYFESAEIKIIVARIKKWNYTKH